MSPQAAQHRSNVERFLGAQAVECGPFGMLGLPVEPPGDETVIRALERRLEQVNAHPYAETPQADEVRLALHAAAAQLLDAQVRRHMLRRWGDGAPAAGGGGAPSPPPRDHPRIPRELLQLEHDAILTLAMHGGWNRRSLHRIAMLARARGVPASRVGDAVRAIAQRRSRPRSAAPVARAPAMSPRPAAPPMAAAVGPVEAVEADAETSAEGRTLWTLVGVVLGVMIVAISLLGLLTVMRPPEPGSRSRASGPEPPAPAVAPQTPPQPEEHAAKEAQRTTPQPVPRSSLALETPQELRQSLDNALSAIELDPRVAVEDFTTIVERLAVLWPQMTPEQRLSTHSTIVDFFYRLGVRSERGVPAADAMAAGVQPLAERRFNDRGEVLGAAWAAGMLTRMSRERDLSAAVTARIDAGLTSAFGGVRSADHATFDAGAIAALGAMPPVLSRRPATDGSAALWLAWADAVEAATASAGVAERHRVLLAGLDYLLRVGPEPSDEKWAWEAISAIVARIDFDEHPPRRWLLTALVQDAYSASDMHVVTGAIVRERRSEHVDLGMSIGASAHEMERKELRGRLAEVWGLSESLDDDAARRDWLAALVEARRELDGAVTASERLAAAARLALLNLAAAQLWNGEPDAAMATLDDIDSRIATATARARSRRMPMASTSEADWAVQYLSVRRNLQARLALLDSLAQRRSRLSIMDAEVLAEEALRADRQPVRERARDVISRFIDQPAVVNGLLEQLPHMPATRRNVELISVAAGVPALRLDDGDWQIAARRVLVERLLELLAAEGDFAIMDELSQVISDAYAGRSGQPASAAGSFPAGEAAAELRLRWRRRAEALLGNPSFPLRLDGIRTGLASRLSVAEGPAQRFAAEQIAIAELMAHVVSAEATELNPRAVAVLDEMVQRRRRAEHLFEQIAAVELAMAELWRLRMGD